MSGSSRDGAMAASAEGRIAAQAEAAAAPAARVEASQVVAVPPLVVADVDTGIDDALALVYLGSLHAAGEVRLRVTTSAGNTTSEQAAANSREVLALVGAGDVPVVAGARRPLQVPLTTTPETHGAKGLGYHLTPDSWRGEAKAGTTGECRRAVESWRGARYLLVAGPATNLEWACRHAPETLADADITLMTGAFHYPGNTTPTAEWNAWVDPHALQAVLASKLAREKRPTLCPLNVTERVVLSPERLDAWCEGLERNSRGGEGAFCAARPGDLAQLLRDALRFYFEFHESVGVGYCAQIHDLAAAMVMLGRVPTVCADATVDVEADSELMRGTTVADWNGEYWQRPPNARVLRELDPTAVFSEFERALS